MAEKQKVAVTIAVEQIDKDHLKTFAHLKMRHQECCGGAVYPYVWDKTPIGYLYHSYSTAFACKRCGMSKSLFDEDDKAAIINIAINGGEFKTISEQGNELIFIQKTKEIEKPKSVEVTEETRTKP